MARAPRLAGPGLALLLILGGCGAAPEVNGTRAHLRVVHQVAAGPRIPGTPGHAAIRAWLESELHRLHGRVELQSFVDTTLGRPLELTNLIARFGPASGRRIALCAHWDTRPFSDQDPDSAHRQDPVPGANDAGSGVAVLLEVAEIMSLRPPPVGVDLVFFDGEDQGNAARSEEFLLGSRRYAASLAAAPPGDARPAAAFLFDMVGDRDLGIHPEVESLQRASNLVAMVLEGAKATGARHFDAAPRYDLIDDHIPLLDAGVPAVDIIDFDYPAWHTHRDLPDRVSAESLAEVSRVAVWLVTRSPLARR
jgi:peptidase M28-like protein